MPQAERDEQIPFLQKVSNLPCSSLRTHTLHGSACSLELVQHSYHKVPWQVPRLGGQGCPFQVLRNAYSILSNKDLRAEHNEETVDKDSAVLHPTWDRDASWRRVSKVLKSHTKVLMKGWLMLKRPTWTSRVTGVGQLESAWVQYTEEPRIWNLTQHGVHAGQIPSHHAFVKESEQEMNARKRWLRKRLKTRNKQEGAGAWQRGRWLNHSLRAGKRWATGNRQCFCSDRSKDHKPPKAGEGWKKKNQKTSFQEREEMI